MKLTRPQLLKLNEELTAERDRLAKELADERAGLALVRKNVDAARVLQQAWASEALGAAADALKRCARGFAAQRDPAIDRANRQDAIEALRACWVAMGDWEPKEQEFTVEPPNDDGSDRIGETREEALRRFAQWHAGYKKLAQIGVFNLADAFMAGAGFEVNQGGDDGQ